jgi:hypothetical protein
MSTFSFGAAEFEPVEEISFGDFVSLAKGRSIVSAGDWSTDDRFELGLSGNLMLRIFRMPGGLEINLISTTNPDEIPPIIFSLGDMPQQVPISVIERKLFGLRTLYAIYFLTHSNRLNELTDYLAKNPTGDIEKNLLAYEESLFIESISYGSWMLAVWAKSKKAYKALSSVVGLTFARGREAYLSKLEAEARIAKARARREEIHAASEEFDLRKKQVEYLRKVSGQIKAPDAKNHVEQIMISAVRDLAAGDPNDSDSFKSISSGEDDKVL